MRRDIDFAQISDGKLYELTDMVKADCGGCIGCHSCCVGMGESIVLDPFDVYQIRKGLDKSFEELLVQHISLNVYDGLILPHIHMGENDEKCSFLDANGRCSIHSFRPGICRLFPLGRYYEDDGTFKYFLQVHECKKENRTKVKVKKWIGIENISEYEKFIYEWHKLINALQDHLVGKEEDYVKKIDIFFLQHFYIENYNFEEDFYEQFYLRLEKAKKIFRL